MLATMAPAGLVVCVASKARSRRAASMRSVRAQHEGRLGIGRQRLVSARHHGIGARSQGMRGEVRVEAEMCRPSGVDDERNAGVVRHTSVLAQVGERAHVRRLDEKDRPHVRVSGDGGGDPLRSHARR